MALLDGLCCCQWATVIKILRPSARYRLADCHDWFRLSVPPAVDKPGVMLCGNRWWETLQWGPCIYFCKGLDISQWLRLRTDLSPLVCHFCLLYQEGWCGYRMQCKNRPYSAYAHSPCDCDSPYCEQSHIGRSSIRTHWHKLPLLAYRHVRSIFLGHSWIGRRAE